MYLSKNFIFTFGLVLLIVLTIFAKDYFTIMPGYFYKKMFIYILICMLFAQLLSNNFQKVKISPIIIFGFLYIIISQSFLYLSTSYEISPIHKITSILLLILIISMHFFALNNFYASLHNKFISTFYKGVYIITGILIVVNLVQLFYILMPSIFSPIVTFIDNNFALHWFRDENYTMGNRFYTIDNTYVKTTMRLNGLSQEAAQNVALLFTTAIPFVLGSLHAKLKRGIPVYIESIMILFLLTILLLAKTSGGIVFFLFTLAAVFYILFRSISLISFLFISISLIFVVLILLLINIDMVYYYYYKIFDLNEGSTLSRMGMTLALIYLWFDNILLGVGKTMINFNGFEYIPNFYWNWEMVEWERSGGFPLFSAFFGFLTEFGLITFIFFTSYVFIIFKRLFKIKNISLDYSRVYFSFVYFVCFLVVAAQLQYEWYHHLILLTFSFFAVIAYNLNLLKVSNV